MKNPPLEGLKDSRRIVTFKLLFLPAQNVEKSLFLEERKNWLFKKEEAAGKWCCCCCGCRCCGCCRRCCCCCSCCRCCGGYIDILPTCLLEKKKKKKLLGKVVYSCEAATGEINWSNLKQIMEVLFMFGRVSEGNRILCIWDHREGNLPPIGLSESWA